MHINDLLKQAVVRGASDLHIMAGVAPLLRINGELTSLNFPLFTADNTLELARQILNTEKLNVLEQFGEVDLSTECQGLGYFRVKKLIGSSLVPGTQLVNLLLKAETPLVKM